MSERTEDAKTLKKALKDQVKREKKAAKAHEANDPSPRSAATSPPPTSPSPAERSAAAAERQVRLQRWRVGLALAGVLIAVATLLATFRPWERGP